MNVALKQQGAEQEHRGAIHLPGGTRAVFAQDDERALAQPRRIRKFAGQERRHAGREGRQRFRVRVARLPRQAGGSLRALGGMLKVAATGQEPGLQRQGARDAVRLAGLERQQQMAGVEIRGTNLVDQRETGDGPAGINPQQTVRRDAIRVACDERQPAPTDPGATPDQRGERHQRARRQPHVQRAEDRPDRVQALVDVTADEELFSGSPLQLDSPPAVGARRGLEKYVRGLRRSAGMGQRRRQAFLPCGGGRRVRGANSRA